MKFQYTSTISRNTKGKLTKRPIVESELIGKSDSIHVLGLIDSGADTTIVTMKVKHFDVPITTAVAFTDSPSVDVLLGQEDFFECFRIKFEKDHDSFDLTLSPKM